jgi:putative oxidoreductase
MPRFLGSSDRQAHLGLLIIRLGLGAAFIAHGLPKLMAGPEKWPQLGAAVSSFGIDVGHQVFGLAAGLAEAGGGLLLILGLLTRLVCIPLLFTMAVAVSFHLGRNEGFVGASHAVEAGVVFLALLIAGPGRYSLDGRMAGPPR